MLSDTETMGKDDFNQKLIDEHTAFYTTTTALRYIKQTERGPENNGDELPFPHGENDLINLGCYYSLAVGQGNSYNEGLYGPLPVLGSEYRVLLYAVMVEDENQIDGRLEGKNYLVLCFFYHERLEKIVSKCRAELGGVFKNYFTSVKSLREVENNWQAIRVMLQNYIYCTGICMKMERFIRN